MARFRRVDTDQLESDLTDIANAIRAKTGITAELSFPSGYVSAVKGIPSGSGGGSSELPFAEVSNFGCVVIGATGMAFYNGVKLPEIPTGLLEKYPYAWIRHNENGSEYDLITGPYPWYVSNLMYTTNSTYIWCKATKESDEWSHHISYTDNGEFPLGNGVVWANHDIMENSTVYLKGSEYKAEAIFGDYAEVAENYNIYGESLNEISEIIQKKMNIDRLLTVNDIKILLSTADFGYG